MSKRLIYLVCFVFALGLVLTSAANAADPNLMGWWRFDGDALDTSGNERHGTLHGSPQFGPGVFGQALEFQDNPDYVTIDGYKGVLGTHAFSITAWVKTANPANIEQIVHWGAHVGGQRVEFRINSTRLRISHGDGNVQGNTDLIDDEWHHVAVTVIDSATASSTDVTFYVDGEDDTMESTDPDGWDIVANATLDVTIGWRPTQQDRPFIGSIDDVRIYDKVLTQEEVLAIMAGGGEGYPFALGPEPADGALHEDTWANLKWWPGDFAVSHDIYIGDNFDDVNDGAEGTFQGNQATTSFTMGFPGFAIPDGLVPGTTYYWRIDEVNDAEPNSPWKGEVWSFSIPPKTAYYPDPADGAELVDPDVQLSWTPGFGGKLHTVYFGDNFDDVNNAAGGLPQGATTYTPGTLKLAKTYYWRVDEFDAVATYKGDVWSFTTEGAVVSLKPSNDSVDVEHTPILTWSPGVYAASHHVYFGTDKDAVKNADTGSPEYKGTRDLGAESYDPGKLLWDATYYWRIDEVNNVNPDSPWVGNIWSFTTANFLVVDDFEKYDVNDNQIWYAWHDGLGYGTPGTEPYYAGNGTGSAVGDETTGSYTEETIVHGGNQSMPLFYDNSILRYSEVEKTLTYPRDWTENGVSTLSIWFRGNSDNAAETLYVALNGNAIVTNDNPDAAQITTWTQWNIDLQAFADQGVNLANVNKIALGLGNKENPVAGGSGTMYFDDIRLYPPPPAP
ncbi:MAG: LamG domain-containing protein [Phycisphaerae bacterium]